MKNNKTTMVRPAALLMVASTARQVVATLEASTKARRSAFGLFAILIYLLIGRAINPGFTDYWWYQLAQTSGTLVVMLTLETVFRREGGLAWQTHAIILATTFADVFGTAGHFYSSYNFYDKVVHFWSGAAFGAGTYEVLRLLNRRGRISLPPPRRALLAVVVSFSIAGVAWEIYEYVADAAFNSGRWHGRLDTTYDLIFDVLGGLMAVTVLRTRESAREHVDRRLTACIGEQCS
jgi:hypothetical protein